MGLWFVVKYHIMNRLALLPPTTLINSVSIVYILAKEYLLLHVIAFQLLMEDGTKNRVLIMTARPFGSVAKYCPGTIRRQPDFPNVS